jgi:aminopeptidase N
MRTYLLTLVLIFSVSSFAQLGKNVHPSIQDMELNRYRAASLQKISGIGTEYDVSYYRLWLRINPDTAIGAYVKGNVTTYFTTLQNNFSLIKFDFVANLNVDSIKYHGAKIPGANYLEDVDTLKITIPSIASTGTLDSVTVFYHGAPTPAAWSTGYVKSTHGSGQNYIYTLSEPYSACTWWPCKTDVTDKADSLDLVISTPVGFKAAGNGTFVSETTDASGVTTIWKHRYPISAYLVCTAVANYQVYNSGPVDINGTTMPVFHWFFPETNTASVRANVDGVKEMLTTFSTWFGDYPFKNEKYGHYEFGFGGGMEHQTFTGMDGSAFTWDIIAHELGHQWFGDGTTCASWSDIWINEGFAQFTEIIAAEKIPSLNGNLAGHRNMVKSNALAYNSETTFRTDASSLVTIFSPSPYIYERGAMILSMLRLTLGDTKFFQAIQNYTSDPLLKYKNAATADVKRHMENVSGLDLADFFDNWIYKTGHAIYDVQWGRSGNTIQLQLIQTKTSGSTASYFDMPVPIRIQGASAGQDTTIVIYDNNGVMNYDNNGVLISTGSNRISYNLSFAPTTVTFDAANTTLATGTVNYLALLPVQYLQLSGKKLQEQIQLNWKASWTGAVRSMNLQRSSDGIHFKNIYSVPASMLEPAREINYVDDKSEAGSNFYRVALELSDEVKYSNAIKFDKQVLNVQVSPNPADDFVLIEMSAGLSSERYPVRIYDGAGRLQGNYAATPGGNSKINVKAWAPGVYVVEVNTNNNAIRSKLIIQH